MCVTDPAVRDVCHRPSSKGIRPHAWQLVIVTKHAEHPAYSSPIVFSFLPTPGGLRVITGDPSKFIITCYWYISIKLSFCLSFVPLYAFDEKGWKLVFCRDEYYRRFTTLTIHCRHVFMCSWLCHPSPLHSQFDHTLQACVHVFMAVPPITITLTIWPYIAGMCSCVHGYVTHHHYTHNLTIHCRHVFMCSWLCHPSPLHSSYLFVTIGVSMATQFHQSSHHHQQLLLLRQQLQVRFLATCCEYLSHSFVALFCPHMFISSNQMFAPVGTINQSNSFLHQCSYLLQLHFVFLPPNFNSSCFIAFHRFLSFALSRHYWTTNQVLFRPCCISLCIVYWSNTQRSFV